VVRALVLSRATHPQYDPEPGLATGYNTCAIPLLAGVAASAGVLLNPAIGGLLMSLSTVIVAVNAMLLRRVQLD
jgi:Cu2+-exporting ATPase